MKRLSVLWLAPAVVALSWLLSEQSLLGGKEDVESNRISFEKQIESILMNNCAIPECHVAPKPAKGLVLEKGRAYLNIVQVRSHENPSMMIVEPGKANRSYLYQKITGNQNEGDRMPPGKRRLSKNGIESIKKWIEQGAHRDSIETAEDSLNPSKP
ncbi:MAG: hypothetical protein L0Y74_06580 [candidate division Zixibacteria bacterium]|nr:hypothetical protein [candidate division Zixibacteria bacterium]